MIGQMLRVTLACAITCTSEIVSVLQWLGGVLLAGSPSSMPIRLRHTLTTRRDYPIYRLRFFEGWSGNISCNPEERTKGIERIEPTIKAKREFI